jgi:hypothetical protein
MDLDNFNRKEMSRYLGLEHLFTKTKRVDWIQEDLFSSERVFCLIGTNRSDYEAAQGLSRTFVGNGSDGLVRIDNAWVCGVDANGVESVPTAKAFVYRAHSGYFGIVNSEESYQNLFRFLFGDLRVNMWVDIDEIRLPPEVQSKADQGQKVDALYQFEVLASPRGKLWYLTRRTAEEDSVACLTHERWTREQKPQTLYLSTVFLDKDARMDKTRNSLAYSMTLGVRVPDYEINRKLWLDQHYEGGYLFRDSVTIEIFPPSDDKEKWKVNYDWQSQNPGKAETPIPTREIDDKKRELLIPFDSQKSPGIRGKLRFVAYPWNDWNV